MPVKSAKNAKSTLKKKPSQQDMQQWLRVLLGTILVCASLSLGSVMGVMARTFNPPKIAKTIVDPTTGETRTIYVAQEQAINPLDILRPFHPLDRKVNILILGSDYNLPRRQREQEVASGQRTRTDTIMLASLDPYNKQISLLSIPRDTRALLTGYHYDKINSAMVYGGIDLVKSTVSDLTGVPIDYYMALKVDGLINMVDVLGGLRIYVEKDMYYVDETGGLGINIHKGWKEAMNGEQANQYVRFRKDELGDIGRVQRQQQFIRAVIDKMMLPQSWLKIPALLEHMNQNIETDIPSDVVGQMFRFGSSLHKDDIRMVMLPGTFATIDGISFWQVLPYQARKVISELFPESSFNTGDSPVADTDPAAVKARYRVSVWNATDDLQTGREVIRRLREAGWNVWAIRKAPHSTPTTQFIAQTGQKQYLKELQDVVGFKGDRVTASVGDIASDFTVLIGSDLVKYYHTSMSAEDWTRAQQQPMPTAPVRQYPRTVPRQMSEEERLSQPQQIPQLPSRGSPAVRQPRQPPADLSWDEQAEALNSVLQELELQPQLPASESTPRPIQARPAQTAPPAAPAPGDVELALPPSADF